MNAVGAHHHLVLGAVAVLHQQRDARLVGAERGQALTQAHLRGGKFSGQSSQQVGAVNGDLGRAVVLLGHVAHAQARSFQAGVPVAADAKGGLRAVAPQLLAYAPAQAVECLDDIGREVDVCAHPAPVLGLLVNRHLVARPRHCNGRGHAAHAAAHHAYVQSSHEKFAF